MLDKETIRKQLIDILEKAGYLSQYPGTMARILVENDVEIPVRCKDCKHYENKEGCKPFCQKFEGLYGYPKEEDFCSYGERRTDGKV